MVKPPRRWTSGSVRHRGQFVRCSFTTFGHPSASVAMGCSPHTGPDAARMSNLASQPASGTGVQRAVASVFKVASCALSRDLTTRFMAFAQSEACAVSPRLPGSMAARMRLCPVAPQLKETRETSFRQQIGVTSTPAFLRAVPQMPSTRAHAFVSGPQWRARSGQNDGSLRISMCLSHFSSLKHNLTGWRMRNSV